MLVLMSQRTPPFPVPLGPWIWIGKVPWNGAFLVSLCGFFRRGDRHRRLQGRHLARLLLRPVVASVVVVVVAAPCLALCFP